MKLTLIAAAVLLMASFNVQAATVGKPAPAFQVNDSHGKPHSLSDYKGKFVVLEWHNQGCPYVKKHYDSGNMQKLQKEVAKNVVWLTVISSAPGKQGYETPAKANDYVKAKGAAPAAVLLDTDGKMGKAYAAKVTPHMYVIDPAGKLIYNGAIDSNDSSDSETIAGATNYVKKALDEALAGKPVTTATTKPYGCSVKYQD